MVKKDETDFCYFNADKEVTDAVLTKNEDIFLSTSHRGSWPQVKNKIPNASKLKFNSLPRGRVEYSAAERTFVVKTVLG